MLRPGFTHSCELMDLVGRHDLGEQDSFELSVNEQEVYFSAIEDPRYWGLHDFVSCYHSKDPGSLKVSFLESVVM